MCVGVFNDADTWHLAKPCMEPSADLMTKYGDTISACYHHATKQEIYRCKYNLSYHLQSVIVNPTFYVGDIFKHPQILLGILKKSVVSRNPTTTS